MNTKNVSRKDAKTPRCVAFAALRLCASLFLLAGAAPAATVVNNGGGTGLVSATGAVVGFGVVSTNTTNPVVIVYYGQNDGGTNASWWTASTNLGAKAVGTNTVTLTNLTSGRMYYTRAGGYEGTNSTNWASSSLSFWTIAGVPTNLGAVNARAVMVDTNGVLVAPTNFFGANSMIIGGEAGNIPQWYAAPSHAGDLVYINDSVPGGIDATNLIAMIAWGWFGSASSNATADFVRSTNGTSQGSFTVAGALTSTTFVATGALSTNTIYSGADGLTTNVVIFQGGVLKSWTVTP